MSYNQVPPFQEGLSSQQYEEKLEKLEALFLNKVNGLEWFYFDLTFQNHEGGTLRQAYRSEDLKAPSWLQNVHHMDGQFQYAPVSPEQPTIDNVHQTTVMSSLMAYIRQQPDAPRKILKRIFDENEPAIHNGSTSHEGIMGKANKKALKKRKKIFDKRIRTAKFQNEGVSILAEGDSWFQHPGLPFLGDSVKDILDHLIKDNKQYAVYSMAAGGDWLSNMIRTSEYISLLDRVSPDYFLFSGGGNDMLGGYRVAKMVQKYLSPAQMVTQKVSPALEHCQETLKKIRSEEPDRPHFDREKYLRGLKFLDLDFFNFLNLCMSQYFLLLSEIYDLDRFSHVKFITQGYDFCKPSPRRAKFPRLRQWFLNWQMNSGRWLYDPLRLKGIYDPKDQEAIIYAMIWEYNEMLIQLSSYFPNLYHIDCRGTAQSDKDWFDEIHLNSRNNRKVANTFRRCIEDRNRTSKVYRVTDSQA